MPHRQDWAMCARIALVVVIGAFYSADADAQQVRVTAQADVFQWRNAGEALTRLPPGTLLEVIDRDGEWVWVVLPRDNDGTRRVGWVKSDAVEVTALAPGASVLQLSPVRGAAPKTPARQQRLFSRWSVHGVAGTTFRTETAPFVGGGMSFNVSPTVQITTEIGRMNDVTSEGLETRGAQLAARTELLLRAVTGRAIDVTARVEQPATYGMTGLRLLMPQRSRFRPYVTGNIGFATIDPEVHLLIGSDDVTSEYVSPSEVPAQRSRLLLGGGGGLNVILTEGVSVDAGYRYLRLYAESGVNVNRGYAGIGVGF